MAIVPEGISGSNHEHIGMQIIHDFLQPDPAQVKHEAQAHNQEHDADHRQRKPADDFAGQLNNWSICSAIWRCMVGPLFTKYFININDKKGSYTQYLKSMSYMKHF